MSNFPHPGKIIGEILTSKEGGNLSITEAANKLMISVSNLTRIIRGQTNLSVDMAVRLSKLIPEIKMKVWMDLQINYDMFLAKQRNSKIKVKPLKTITAEFIEKIFKKYKFEDELQIKQNSKIDIDSD